MTVSVESSGTITTDGTEQNFAAAVTSAGVRVLNLDTSHMADGDAVEVRLYTIAKSGGSEAQYYMASFANAQAAPLKQSIPVPSAIDFRATIKRVNGSDRSYDWSIQTL
jgi:hypothetical protein